MNELKKKEFKTFDSFKHIDEEGCEFWYARELMILLEYSKWEIFQKVIKKAMISCKKSHFEVTDHFIKVGKIIESNKRKLYKIDYKLTRHACYLIVQNADSRKKIVAATKCYIVNQTIKAESIANNLNDNNLDKIATSLFKMSLVKNLISMQDNPSDQMKLDIYNKVDEELEKFKIN